jgi:hypothetical protein
MATITKMANENKKRLIVSMLAEKSKLDPSVALMPPVLITVLPPLFFNGTVHLLFYHSPFCKKINQGC